jgi:hypothetical protein
LFTPSMAVSTFVIDVLTLSRMPGSFSLMEPVVLARLDMVSRMSVLVSPKTARMDSIMAMALSATA